VRRTGVVLVALAVLVGACGVSEDDEPRAIPIENVPFDLVDPNVTGSTTAPASALTEAVPVYFISRASGQPLLEPAEREVQDSQEPRARIEALLEQRPDEAETADGMTSSIPSETKLLSVEVTGDGTVSIDLSSDLLAVAGQELVLAFAQLVYSATEVTGISRVQFRVDGRETNALDANGQERSVVSRTDYDAVRPAS
jgi:spore germination protein GerM